MVSDEGRGRGPIVVDHRRKAANHADGFHGQ
jgi:hypothetical protein